MERLVFIDGRTIPEGTVIEGEICIVGAGAAGTTLARELAGKAIRVVLLESGGLEFDEETQSLYAGDVLNDSYMPLDEARLRYFGGSTNHWEGRSRPLEESDFEHRPWIPHSGWPLTKAELDPYYIRAARICHLSSDDYDPSKIEKKIGSLRLPLDERKVKSIVFYESLSPRIGENHKAILNNSESIHTFLFSNMIELKTDSAIQAVRFARVRTLEGNEFSVAAQYFVLASGGIENARILLLSNRIQSVGLGNGRDLVGRFFMEHPYRVPGAWLLPQPGLDLNYYAFWPKTASGEPVACMNWLALSDEVVAREGIAGYSVWPQVREGWCCWSYDGGESIRHFRESVSRVEFPNNVGEHVSNIIAEFDVILDRVLYEMHKRIFGQPEGRYIRLITSAEHVPNPESRVVLVPERDSLGQRRVQLQMRGTELDRRTIVRGTELVAAELAGAGLGRVRMLLDETETWPFAGGRAHHMGTTRMSTDPKHGVVDANCKLHDVANVFVAGSSVFPTSGFGVPTLTIVALAIRLAEHLEHLIKRGG